MSTKIHVIPTFHHDIAYLEPEETYTIWATEIKVFVFIKILHNRKEQYR